MTIKVLILAGGSGTRLWPLSRKYYPKQFLKMKEFNNTSFFEKAMNRAKMITSEENIFVITNKDYKFHCINQSLVNENNVIVENEPRNTLGAICLGIEKGLDEDIFLVLSSDHIMESEEIFSDIVINNKESANKNIVIFGVKPSKTNTGYGYISFEKEGIPPYKVLSFKEKPDEDKAIEFIKNGYYWNAGIFMFSKKVFLSELEKSNGNYFSIIKNGISKNFKNLPDLSIDYGLLEKSDNIRIIPLDIYWNDLGGFEAFSEYFNEHKIKTDICEIESKNNFIIQENNKKETVIIGLDNITVVDTNDAILISKKGETQKVKQALEKLRSDKKYHTDFGVTIYRPWGSYTIIDEGGGYKTKRLTVLPGKKLSSQSHFHRSEHWVVVNGTAKVTLDEKDILLRKGESTYIPIGIKHRLENIGKIELYIIESQIGDYLEEDDIVRFDDDFGRF